MCAVPELAQFAQPFEFGSNCRSQFQVGGVSVQVSGTCCRDVALVASLEPFRLEVETPDICVEIERASRLSDKQDRRLFDSGSVWRLHEHDEGFLFDFSTPPMGASPYKRLILDREFRRGRLLINESCFTSGLDSAAPLDYPLDELLIMHRLTQEKAIELHGSGIVRANGIGNLFVGHSGAGKSTTTRLWTEREKVEVLSDDRIIVRHDASSPTSMRMHGTPWHGEAMYASPNSAPLARIFVLEHGHGNVITPLTPSQAVAELFARSFVPFHRHEYVDSALIFLEELANAVPVYRYAFEPDQRAVEKIRNFHD
jgi:hypothetical protein